jgi:hypothetical protein
MSFFPLVPKLHWHGAAILCGVLTFCMAASSQVRRGYLGVNADDLTPDRVAALNLTSSKGAEITRVGPDSPAAKAGLKEHDVIVGFNGEPVMNVDQLMLGVQNWTSSLARIGIVRGGREMMLDVAAQNEQPQVNAVEPVNRDGEANQDKKEAAKRAAAFQQQLFPKCDEAYYSGPFLVDNRMGLGCNFLVNQASQNCQMAVRVETTGDQPIKAQPDGPSRDGYEWEIYFDASGIRTTYRIDGNWRPWGDSAMPSNHRVIIGALYKRGDDWYARDMRMTGLAYARLTDPLTVFGSILANANTGENIRAALPTQFDSLLNTLEKPSCAEIRGVIAPGHSLSDTYSRTMEIIRENKSKSIRDSLAEMSPQGPQRQGGRGGGGGSLFRPLPVCYSISDSRKCDATGETVVFPGDLKMPPGFWNKASPNNYFRLCAPTNGVRLEVTLTEPSSNGKRYMACADLSWLEVRRQQLIELGVKQ